MLQSIACPSCGTPLDLKQTAVGAQVHCDACGSAFLLNGHICPHCGTYHEEAADFCRQCGNSLRRRCPHCDTVNWIGDEFCVHCGSALDILELVVQRHHVSTQQHLYAQQEEAQRLKAAEQVASQARTARLQAQDRQREAEIRRRLVEQQAREKQLLTRILVVTVVFIVFFSLIMIFS